MDAAIGQLFAPYRLGGCHGHQFLRKKSSCGVVEIAFRSKHSKGTKRTLYSAHRRNKLRRKVEPQLKPKSTANFLAIKR
jgi:hypothetical protein